jgi:hypothetical protein
MAFPVPATPGIPSLPGTLCTWGPSLVPLRGSAQNGCARGSIKGARWAMEPDDPNLRLIRGPIIGLTAWTRRTVTGRGPKNVGVWPRSPALKLTGVPGSKLPSFGYSYYTSLDSRTQRPPQASSSTLRSDSLARAKRSRTPRIDRSTSRPSWNYRASHARHVSAGAQGLTPASATTAIVPTPIVHLELPVRFSCSGPHKSRIH